jgi:hypothetical protein
MKEWILQMLKDFYLCLMTAPCAGIIVTSDRDRD